ncbi:hypothetical protein [Microtetraspora malaysiensis]|uniref:sulfotransferase-like domain-containing protein n=1 Tax=Microtetraspora malaysiensis TaxID=161358 RepID=UPI003D89C02C
MTVIMLWAHTRSISTAFLRMMIERGDVLVLHEPLIALTELGEVPVPTPEGGSVPARTEKEFLELVTSLSRVRPVFVKDVFDYRYEYFYDHPDAIAGITHTFLVRHPRQTISSHYAMKPTVTSQEIGYERQYELFEAAWAATGRKPLVIRSERLVSDPVSVVESFCAYAGLPFLPHSLRWSPGERPEWQRYRAWHVDAIHSTGFSGHRNDYAVTVDNNALLKSYYDHHYPFYELLVRHAD